jgi:TatD DNase family protein
MSTLPPLDMHAHPCHAGGAPIIPDTRVFAVSVTPEEWATETQVFQDPGTIWGLGLHPWWLQNEKALEPFFAELDRSSAVGEIGLDYTGHAPLSADAQRAVLSDILDHPATRDRLVNLHALLAYDDMVALLAEHPTPGALIHWYCDPDLRLLDRAIEQDIFFTVNDAMFAIEEQGQIIADLPRERVFVESDAPYIERDTGLVADGGLLPWVEAGDPPEDVARRLRSGEVARTERSLAQLWGVSPEDVRLQMWSNLAELESRLAVRPFGAAEVLAAHATSA